MSELKCVYHDKALLGEGALWSEREQKLYWVDIEGHRVCRYDPDTGENDSVPIGQQIGTVVERASGGLVIGLKDGVYALDFPSGSKELLCDPQEGDLENRLNDGKAGPDGRLYVGGMGPDGKQSLYRVEKDGERFAAIVPDVSISNGLAWTADAKTFYYTDSPQRLIWAYDFDIETGTPSNRRVIVDTKGEDCVPDGMTIDEEGMLWVAFFDGWCVRRYNPDTGEMIQRIDLPVSKVTTCTFGGPDLGTLYITSASVGLDAAGLEREPLAGGVFSIKPGVKGTRAFLFGE